MTLKIQTDVAIIGDGPAGMLLSHMLDLSGIKSVVIEQKPPAYVVERVRAGMLESGTVDVLRQAGLAERLNRDAIIQEKVHYGFQGKETLILDLKAHTGRWLTAYSQTAITQDLYAAHDRAARMLFDGVADAQPHDLMHSPHVTFTKGGQTYDVKCSYIVGCDGFHGVSRPSIPTEFHHRVTTDPSIEKSIAPLRSFMSEPMQYGRLFLAGDAAHIVPSTGAKGLNLAISDVYYLHRAMGAFSTTTIPTCLRTMAQRALRRVWSSVNLTWKLFTRFRVKARLSRSCARTTLICCWTSRKCKRPWLTKRSVCAFDKWRAAVLNLARLGLRPLSTYCYKL